MILNLQTSAFGSYGGIATYNRLICRALNDFNEADKRCVLLATDTSRDVELQLTQLPNLSLEACNSRRPFFVQKLLALAARHRIDLALIGHVNYAPLGLLLKRLQPNLRYGVLMYGIDVWKRLPPLRRYALQQADFAISISRYTRDRAIAANNIEADRVHLLPNALEWHGEPQDKAVNAPLPIGTRLLTVCRLDSTEKYKGVDTVIKALPGVLAVIPDIQYTIVGSGSDITRLQKVAVGSGVGGRVHFLGSLADDLLRACYQACDIFVMPSAKEGFGFVFLEAMHYEKPIVAANKGGSPEVVQDEVTGLLVEYGDIPQLAASLTRLCLDPKLRTSLGSAGYRRLQRHFTFSQFQQKLTQVLREELPVEATYRNHSRTLTRA